MENTIENKEKFMAQYWHQPVLRFPNNDDKLLVKDWFVLKNGWLELKPLSSISDEDAIEVAKIYFSRDNDESYHTISNGKALVNRLISDWLQTSSNGFLVVIQVADYLRSRSYAIPFMGLSVETMVQYGWVKLTH